MNAVPDKAIIEEVALELGINPAFEDLLARMYLVE